MVAFADCKIINGKGGKNITPEAYFIYSYFKIIYSYARYTHKRNSIYYSYIGSYLKAVKAIAEIWNSILCFYSSS